MRHALLLIPLLLLAIPVPTSAADEEVPQTYRALYGEKGRRWKYSEELWALDEKEKKKREKAKKKKKGEEDAPEEAEYDFKHREKTVHAYWEYEITKVEDKIAHFTHSGYDKDGELDSIITDGRIALDAPMKTNFGNSGKYSELRKETVAVGQLNFECSVYEVESSGANWLEWYAIKYPGLMVRRESHSMPEDTIGVMVLVDIEGFGEPDRAEEKPAAGVDAWTLFRNPGRNWRIKREAMIGGKPVPATYTTYEITAVDKESCKLKTQALKANQTPMMEATTVDIAFTKDNELWIKPLATAVEDRKEKLTAAGREWQCIVYVDTKAVKGSTLTSWMAADFPGLWVKSEDKNEKGEVTATTILDKFSE